MRAASSHAAATRRSHREDRLQEKTNTPQSRTVQLRAKSGSSLELHDGPLCTAGLTILAHPRCGVCGGCTTCLPDQVTRRRCARRLGVLAGEGKIWCFSCILPHAVAGSDASSLGDDDPVQLAASDDEYTWEHEPSSLSHETTTSPWELRACRWLILTRCTCT